MAFSKIEKSTNIRIGTDAHAVFSITKKGIGSLRVNKRGMKFLDEKRIKLLAGDKVDLYFDDETKNIAILRSQIGEFRLGINNPKNNTIRITSSDLKNKIGKYAEYDMESSKEYDVILVARDQNKQTKKIK